MSELKNQAQVVDYDVEKASSSSPSPQYENEKGPVGTLSKWNARIEGLSGFEARGLERVPESERQAPSKMGLLQMLLLWFSANITINNLAVGLLGPLVFELGFADSAMCAVIGVLLGSSTTSYMSIWGAASGNRTMVVLRYFFGYYPSKIATFLNIILLVGWAVIDAIIGGQVLSAVSGGHMSIEVGIVIVTVIQTVIAVFGMKPFQQYERYAWLPQLIVLLVLAGVSGKNFNTSLKSIPTGSALASARLSFLTTCFYIPNAWAGAASDYYVYYPSTTPKWKVFLLTLGGLTLSFWFVDLLGIGLGCGVAAIPAWAAANDISSGALIVAGYAPVGGFGKFCSVIVALGAISNSTPSIYSGAICCQIMGRFGQRIPRWVWVIFLVIIQLVCGLAGRNQLFTIFENFLALMGYWLMPMICIVAEEHVFFKWRTGWDWDAWQDRSRLPIGLAALTAFLLAWAGAVLGMYETWFVGPLAIAANDADVGMWVGSGFALITYPVLRWLELKKFGR